MLKKIFGAAMYTLAVFFASIVFNLNIAAEEFFLYSPHYGIEFRDANIKTLPVGGDDVIDPPTEIFNSSGIEFSIWFMDVYNANGIGFDGPNGAAARARVRDALTYLAGILQTPGTLDVLVEVSDPTLYPAGFLASAGTYFPNAPGFHGGSAQFRLLDPEGDKQFANTEEINLKIVFNQNWNYTGGLATATQLDFLSILIHEFMHGLGIVSLSSATGDSAIAPGVYSWYDFLLRHPSNSNLEIFDASENYVGPAGALTGNQLIFFGGNAYISYNRNVNIPVHSPGTFVQGTSLSHWSPTRLEGNAVLLPVRAFGDTMRDLRPHEIAALRDIGYSNVVAPVEIVGEGEGEGEIGGEGEGEGVSEGEGEGEEPPLCGSICPKNPGAPDSDDDGLSDTCEQCLGTNVNNPDTDNDGLPDSFEYQYGLNAFDPSDAPTDLDNDGITTLDEFRYGSNPLDIDDPRTVRFVDALLGVDNPGYGLPGLPWQTINYALSQINGPATLRLAANGVFVEDVVLEPDVKLIGESCPLGGGEGSCSIIEGTVIGANNATLKNVTITTGTDTAPMTLLNMNNVVMTISNVQFFGNASRAATAILVSGAAPADSVIENCHFESLNIGIDIAGAIPKIRRNHFENHATAYIVIRASVILKSLDKIGSLGDTTDSETGFNNFAPPISSTAVVNESGETISMENNYWGTSSASAVADRVDGPADVEPFLASASAILASSIVCTVWEDTTQKRVLNATVAIAPGGVKSVTDNTNGVYVFAALPAGSYTVNAIVPGFSSASRTVNVAAGAQASIVLAVAEDATPEGEEEGEDEGEGEDDGNGGCGCTEGDNKTGQMAGWADRPADMLIVALMFLALVVSRNRALKGS